MRNDYTMRLGVLVSGVLSMLLFHSAMGQTITPTEPHQDSKVFLPLVMNMNPETDNRIPNQDNRIPNQYIVVFNDFMLQSVNEASADLEQSVGGSVLFTFASALQGFVIKLPEVRAAWRK